MIELLYRLKRWLHYRVGNHIKEEQLMLSKILFVANINIYVERLITNKFINKVDIFDIGLKSIDPLAVNNILIPEESGGINSGDRKLLFSIISYLKPKSVLEIGTCLGSSTASIVAALDNNSNLTTVDIDDVNNINANWHKRGCSNAPNEIVSKINSEVMVDFIRCDSLEFLMKTHKTFDCIFLDGLHSAERVYLEIQWALQKINHGGFIILHDFYPKNKRYWSSPVIPGPYLAVDRLIRENQGLNYVTFDKLPWKTKFNSYYSTLCILVFNLNQSKND